MKIIPLLVFTFVNFSTIAQMGLEDVEIKGKLKSVNKYEYYYSNDTVSSVNTYNYFYNADGLLIKELYSHSEKDSLFYSVVFNFFYDSLKRLLYTTSNDSSNITRIQYLNKKDTTKVINFLSYFKGKLTNETILKLNAKSEKLLSISFDYTNNKY